MNDSALNQTEMENQPQSPRMLLESMVAILLKRYLLFIIVFLSTAVSGIVFTIWKPLEYLSLASISIMNEEKGLSDMSSYMPLSQVINPQNPQEFFSAILNSVLFRKRLIASLDSAGYTPPEGLTIDKAINKYLEFIIPKNSYFVNIQAITLDPQTAFLLVDKAVDAFLDRSQEIQREEFIATIEFLDNQLQVIDDELEKVERDIQEFGEQHQIDLSEPDGGVWGKYFDLQTQLIDAEVKITLAQRNNATFSCWLENLLEETIQDLKGGASPLIQTQRKSISKLEYELDSLSTNYINDPRISQIHTELAEARQELLNTISSLESSSSSQRQLRSTLIESLIQRKTDSELVLVSMNNEHAFIQERIQKFREDHPDLLESALTLARLSRSKELYLNTVNILLENREEVRIQSASKTGGIKIIDPPYFPEKPEPSRKILLMIISIMLALTLGAGACYITESLDDSIKSTAHINRILRLSVLGHIPVLKPIREDGNPPAKFRSAPYILIDALKPKDRVVEAYRALKTSIVFSAPDTERQVLTITSPGVREGKSLTSSNLAISYAESDQRTLLVDCDLRKPVLHRVFGLERKPGLTSYLVGEIEPEDICRATRVNNLTLIPAGHSTPNPADLINSRKMKEFIDWARRNYDVVLFDSPPLTVTIDARILSTFTDGTVLVVLAEKTKLEITKFCTEQLRQSGVKVLGTVLNRISVRKIYEHYYHYNYNYYYYRSDDDEE